MKFVVVNMKLLKGCQVFSKVLYRGLSFDLPYIMFHYITNEDACFAGLLQLCKK